MLVLQVGQVALVLLQALVVPRDIQPLPVQLLDLRLQLHIKLRFQLMLNLYLTICVWRPYRIANNKIMCALSTACIAGLAWAARGS